MIRKVKAYIEENRLLTNDQPVIVGLSGGADSVALLAVLQQLGYSCIAAHCNFHLRGNESDRDEVFARELAGSMSIPFHAIDFDTRAYASEQHISIEMAARDLRYKWFSTLQQQSKAQAIAIAHHQDDSIETMLINLVRGTGIKGLRGIRPKNGLVIRPLLCVNRAEIITWLKEQNLFYITDSTNNADIYTRNFIRLRVLPLLEEINPSVREALLRTSTHLSDVEVIYDQALKDIISKVMPEQGCISIPAIKEHPAPVTILYELLHPYGFNRFTINEIYKALDKEPGKTFFSPGYELLKDRGFLLLTPLSPGVENKEYYIHEEESNCSEPVKLFWKKVVIDKEFSIRKSKNIAYFDYNKLSFPLTLRTWQPGDWFIPFGMKGRKKLSDYFTDQKINRLEKNKIWLLCSGNDIIWIIGERTDNRFKINHESTNAFIVNFSD